MDATQRGKSYNLDNNIERALSMSYKRENDKSNGRYSRTIDKFDGLHMGYSWTDQPPSFSFGCDFHYGYSKPELRPGYRKNQLLGYDGTVAGLYRMQMGGIALLGVIQNNNLSVYPVDDVLAGIRKYYTWQELYDNFTWAEVGDKTWDDLFNGDNNP